MSTNRFIARMVCLLTLEVIACTLTTALLLNVFSETISNPEDYRQLAYWVRSWGFTLLLVPAAWAGFFLISKEKDESLATCALSGYLILGALSLFYVAALNSACKVPRIQLRPKSQPRAQAHTQQEWTTKQAPT
jgi:hypothetical protein